MGNAISLEGNSENGNAFIKSNRRVSSGLALRPMISSNNANAITGRTLSEINNGRRISGAKSRDSKRKSSGKNRKRDDLDAENFHSRNYNSGYDHPAGVAAEPIGGRPGSRWPIAGVVPDSAMEVGNLKMLTGEGNPHSPVIAWTIDLSNYTQCIDGRDDMAAPKEGFKRRYESHMFKVHGIGGRLIWRLVWGLKDHNDETMSLYLECVNFSSGETSPVIAKFAFSMGEAYENVEDPSVKSQQGNALHAEMEHIFTGDRPAWGAQRFVRFEDVDRFRCGSTLTVHVHMKWCRDTYYFPRQAIMVNESGPEMYLISVSPRILMIENFLSMAECERLIEVATPRLARSKVSSGTETPSRTSWGMFFTQGLERHPIVRSVEGKIARLIARQDVCQGRMYKMSEALQAVKYDVGEFYSEHYDYRSGSVDMRAMTFLCYLRDVELGGATYFPRSSGVRESLESAANPAPPTKRPQGVRVYPRRGRAIVFWSRMRNGEPDKASVHAAEKVLKGQKWITTRWMREVDSHEE